MLAELSHPNILPFLGYVTNSNLTLASVYPSLDSSLPLCLCLDDTIEVIPVVCVYATVVYTIISLIYVTSSG